MPLGKFGKIGICWTVLTFLGIGGFAASKISVDKRRYESMKVRERMRKSNEGEYTVPETKRFDY